MPDEFEQPQRLHPLTLVYRLAMSLPGFFLLLYPVLQGGQEGAWVNILMTVVYGIFALPWAILYYYRFQFYITPDHVTIHKGIIQRQDRSIPIERVQNIEIQQSLLQRLLGLTSVRLETAGSEMTEGKLEYVSVARAQHIRQVIRSYQRQKEAPDVREEPDHTTEEDIQQDVAAPPRVAGVSLYTMSLSRVFLRGCFRFSLFYLFIIFSAFEYLNVDPEQWLTQERFDPYWQLVSGSPYMVGLITVFVAAVLGWATGALETINRYFQFALSLEGDKLHKRRGLLTTAEGTIPLEKVQAYVLRSNILMRWFGWYSLEVQAMGLDSEIEGRQVAAPLIGLEAAENLLSHLRPTTLPDRFERVSPVTIRRAFVRYSVGLLVLVVPAAIFWQSSAWWGLALLPILLYFAVLQYRHHGFVHDEPTNTFIVRRGVIQHRIWIVPVESVQVLYRTRSLFQRRLDLGSLHIDTAGGPSTNYPQVIDLPKADAERRMDKIWRRLRRRP